MLVLLGLLRLRLEVARDPALSEGHRGDPARDRQCDTTDSPPRRCVELLAWRPDSDEAAYLLGECEHARGRTRAAEVAWSRVPPGSSFAPQAILGRMQIEVERGRLAEAERIVSDALEDPRIDGSSLPILLGPIYCQQGRLEETLRLIENRWEALNRTGRGGVGVGHRPRAGRTSSSGESPCRSR